MKYKKSFNDGKGVLDDTFTLRDFETPAAEVTVSERQYRACVLDFLHNDDAVMVDLWAGKISIACRDGFNGPSDRHFELEKLTKAFIALCTPKPKNGRDEFGEMVIHLLQTRAAFQKCLRLIETAIEREVLARPDGTSI